jgi:ABC-type multidrug transport system permease subunit
MSANKMKKLTDKDIFLMNLELERAKFERERAIVALNKALFLYFTCLFIGIIGIVKNLMTAYALNLLIFFGIVMLIIGFIPYFRITVNERKLIDSFIERVKHG